VGGVGHGGQKRCQHWREAAARVERGGGGA
jgi:hypothetical protein